MFDFDYDDVIKSKWISGRILNDFYKRLNDYLSRKL